MKISKNKVEATTSAVKSNTNTNANTKVGKYSDSQKYIRCAIDSLGASAKTDARAREAIANLSVVLFDLQ